MPGLQVNATFRAKDSSAQLATAWRLVQVQQVYSVTITLPLTLAAANLTDAQAQAQQITTSPSGLASALAAGLIAGQAVALSTSLPVHSRLVFIDIASIPGSF